MSLAGVHCIYQKFHGSLLILLIFHRVGGIPNREQGRSDEALVFHGQRCRKNASAIGAIMVIDA